MMAMKNLGITRDDIKPITPLGMEKYYRERGFNTNNMQKVIDKNTQRINLKKN